MSVSAIESAIERQSADTQCNIQCQSADSDGRVTDIAVYVGIRAGDLRR